MLSALTRSVRRLVPVCVLSTAAVAALAAPGAANAATRLPNCTEGTPVNGEGSTLQEPAMQKVWAPAYTSATNKNTAACPGGPKVTYNTKGKTGSGQGMKNWYELDEFGPEAQGFVGTDNPPTADIKTKIEQQQEIGGAGKVLTIPTLQAAVAIIVHLPTGCTVSSEPQPGLKVGRLVLTQKKVEEIFRNKLTWLKLKTAKNNVLAGSKCTKVEKESKITRVVREDGSGTTATLKKWLELVNAKAEKVVNGKTWLESGEEPPANTEWPEETVNLLRGNGSGGVIEAVEKTAGTIGYVNLANARNGKGKGIGFVPPAAGEGTAEFWAKLENKKTVTVEGTTYKVYTDPASNGEVAAKENANCIETEYVSINPATGKAEVGKFPPPSTESTWNTVSAGIAQKNYALCGFTYDLSLTHYEPFKGPYGPKGEFGATEEEATTAGDFLEFVLNEKTEGGQALIGEAQDYLGLPTNSNPKKNVLKIAQEGAKKISY
jgi:ABC-type phosphate transport system substrate-binding protein